MESLVSFFRNGLGVKVSFQGVIQEHADVFIQMDYFHLFIMYLDRPVSVPQSPEINYHLFSFVRMQVRVWLNTPFCEVIAGWQIANFTWWMFGKKHLATHARTGNAFFYYRWTRDPRWMHPPFWRERWPVVRWWCVDLRIRQAAMQSHSSCCGTSVWRWKQRRGELSSSNNPSMSQLSQKQRLRFHCHSRYQLWDFSLPTSQGHPCDCRSCQVISWPSSGVHCQGHISLCHWCKNWAAFWWSTALMLFWTGSLCTSSPRSRWVSGYVSLSPLPPPPDKLRHEHWNVYFLIGIYVGVSVICSVLKRLPCCIENINTAGCVFDLCEGLLLVLSETPIAWVQWWCQPCWWPMIIRLRNAFLSSQPSFPHPTLQFSLTVQIFT